MSDVNVLVGTIRNKVRKLINHIQSLEQTNNKLKEKQEALELTIENQQKLIDELKDSNKRAYIAESIKQTEGSSEVRKRIDEMVREIDNCIELLNK